MGRVKGEVSVGLGYISSVTRLKLVKMGEIQVIGSRQVEIRFGFGSGPSGTRQEFGLAQNPTQPSKLSPYIYYNVAKQDR